MTSSLLFAQQQPVGKFEAWLGVMVVLAAIVAFSLVMLLCQRTSGAPATGCW